MRRRQPQRAALLLLAVAIGVQLACGLQYGYYSNTTTNGTAGVYGGLTTNTTTSSLTTGTVRFLGPLVGCTVSFGTPTGKNSTVVSKTDANGTFTFNQTSAGSVEISVSGCKDAFTDLPPLLPLNGLASNLGRLSFTPASLLTSAYVKNHPELADSLYTTSMITSAYSLAYSYIGVVQPPQSGIMGIADPLAILRNVNETNDRKILAAAAYSADVQYVALLSMAGSYLAQISGAPLPTAAAAISRVIDSQKGVKLTNVSAIVSTINNAAVQLSLDLNITVSLVNRTAVTTLVSGYIAAFNSMTADGVAGAVSPWLQPTSSIPVDVASLVLSLSAMSVAHQTLFADAAAKAAATNTNASFLVFGNNPIEYLFVSNPGLLKINNAAVLAYFGLPNAQTTDVTVSAIGSVANCPLALANFLGNLARGTTSSKGLYTFTNVPPAVLYVNPSNVMTAGVCVDSVTNTRVSYPIVQPMPAVSAIAVTPISSLAMSILAARRNYALQGPTNMSVTALQVPENYDIATYEFSAEIIATAYEAFGFNEKDLGVNFTTFSGTKLQNGQPLKAATLAASGQLLGLISIGTSFVSNMKKGGPGPDLVSKHFLRATVNAAIAAALKTGKPSANITQKAVIKTLMLDALKGAFGEFTYQARLLANRTASSGRRLLQTADTVTDPFTDGTFDVTTVASLTNVVDALATTVATTNTMLETTKQAAMAADTAASTSTSTSTSTPTFNLTSALMEIAQVSSVQQNDVAKAVVQLAAAATDPAQAATLNSTLNSFSSSFSGSSLDAKIEAAKTTINTAEIQTLATPPANTTSPAPVKATPIVKKKKKSNGTAIGVGVGVGVGGGLLVAGVAGYFIMKRKATQTVGAVGNV